MPVNRWIRICVAAIVACGGAREVEEVRSGFPRGGDASRADRLEAKVLEALEHTMADHPEIVNATVAVHLLSRDVRVERAAGESVPLAGESMTPRTPFRTASIGKTMTATVVLQLVEEGRLSLDDTLELLDGVIPVDRLHVLDGVSYGRSITVEQLLRQRSGLPDYFFDGAPPGGLSDYVLDVLANPARIRTPGEIVQWIVDHLQPVAVPGSTYHYADTNYLLLGLLVEHVEHKPLPQVYRERLFAPLEIRDAYLEFYEASRARLDPAHMFIGPVDTAGVALGEWGGGGVVATAKDLDRFLGALAKGRLFRSRATLQAMIPTDEARPGFGYGFGIARHTDGPAEYWGHDGFFGSFAYYAPAADAVVTGTIDQATTDVQPLVHELIAAALEASR